MKIETLKRFTLSDYIHMVYTVGNVQGGNKQKFFLLESMMDDSHSDVRNLDFNMSYS